MKNYLGAHFSPLCFFGSFFLLIFLFHHDGWQVVLNSINFISLWLKRINIPDNKGHLKCSQGLKPGEKIWPEGWRDWQQGQQQEWQWSSKGDGSGGTLCPWTNALNLQGLSDCLCCEQQCLRLQKDNLTAHKKVKKSAHIMCSCLHSVDNRLNLNQLRCKQGC